MALLPLPNNDAAGSWMHRRNFLLGTGATGMALGTALGTAYTQIATGPDYTLRIAPLRLELAPGKVIETLAYNGTVPGPVLRLREGRQVGIDIRNDTDVDESCTGTASMFPRKPTERWRKDRRWWSRRHAALRVHRQARRARGGTTATTCREGSHPKPVLRDVRLPDYRAGRAIPAATTGRCSWRRTTGKADG